MTDSEKVHLDVMHDHYKESFAHIREREKQRDRLFLILIALLGLLFLEVQYPTNIVKLLKEVGKSGIKLDVTALPITVILSVTWTIFLALMLRYCKVSMTVERQYNYLHKLESKISSLLQDDVIYRREGKEYLRDYPIFSEWAWFFYTIMFPMIVVGVEVYLICLEYRNKPNIDYNTLYDLIMAFGVGFSLALYRGVPPIRYCWRKLRKENQ